MDMLNVTKQSLRQRSPGAEDMLTVAHPFTSPSHLTDNDFLDHAGSRSRPGKPFKRQTKLTEDYL
jgi:hypothetical protein